MSGMGKKYDPAKYAASLNTDPSNTVVSMNVAVLKIDGIFECDAIETSAMPKRCSLKVCCIYKCYIAEVGETVERGVL